MKPIPTKIQVFSPSEGRILSNVASDVFEGTVDTHYATEFVAAPRYCLALALADDLVLGMSSCMQYVHPDKPLELFINEVGIADACQVQGLGRRLLDRPMTHARALGCVSAWVLTEEWNTVARRLYRLLGGMEAGTRIFVILLVGDA